jgi:hypothetical protein
MPMPKCIGFCTFSLEYVDMSAQKKTASPVTRTDEAAIPFFRVFMPEGKIELSYPKGETGNILFLTSL